MQLAAAWGYALPWELIEDGRPSERWRRTMEAYLRGRRSGG